ncbi:hypothetical protein PC112_g10906 [Phytophthora cactorum]|nr:hypothetical protein PC112_g10906 [Phytophthora cactorum]
MESCHLDADLDYESIPIFTQKESLEAFLPSRVVALVNVVELIDQFAMTPKEAAVEAAREGNVERLETKQISAGIIRSTFDNAVDACIHDHCRRGHAKLVAFLCNNEYVSRTAAEHAFTEGVDSGSVLLMKSVCNNRSISPALGAKMLVRAIRKEQFGVVNFLWGQSWI